MSFLPIRKSLSIVQVCKFIWKNVRQGPKFSAVRSHSSFLSRASGTHTQKKGPEGVKYIESICNLLRRGGNWDNLNADFKSIELANDLVETILLNLKEPTDAKKALVFFHWCSHQRKFRHGLRSYCVIAHILVCAGLLIDAQAMLDSAIRKHSETGSSGILIVETLLSTHDAAPSSPRVFDLLVQTYSKLRMPEMAFESCCYLSEHGYSSSLVSFNTLLHVVQKSDNFDLIWKIYEHMLLRRTYPNQATSEIMIAAMCKGGALQKTVDVLDRIHGKRCSPGVIVNTALALRMIERNRAQEGAVLLNRMLQKNMVLDDVAYSLTIYAHCKMDNLELAYDLYDNLVKRGQCLNSFIFTSFIGIHCKEGRVGEANVLFQQMLLAGLKPYDETYNFLIECCSRVGRVEESLAFYEEMLGRGFLPSCVAVNEMIGKLCESERVEKANNMLTVLLDKGFVPNEVSYSNLIEGFGRIGNAQEIFKIYYEIEWKGPFPGQVAYTSLIRSLCQCGKLTEAERYLSVMKDKSLVPSGRVYDALIKAHCENGNIERGLHFYDKMIQKELEPSSHSFAILTERILSGSTIEVQTKCYE